MKTLLSVPVIYLYEFSKKIDEIGEFDFENSKIKKGSSFFQMSKYSRRELEKVLKLNTRQFSIKIDGLCVIILSDDTYRKEKCSANLSSENSATYQLDSGTIYRIQDDSVMKPKINGYWTEETSHELYGKCYPILEENISFCFKEINGG